MQKVVIYSTPTCGYCKTAMRHFDDNGISYEKVDVSADRDSLMAMVKMSGQMGVPVIAVGDSVLVGWNVREFNDTYGREEGADSGSGTAGTTE